MERRPDGNRLNQAFALSGASFRGRLADWVYIQLTEDVEAGTLTPGSMVSEKDLIDRFQTSRTPIREALQRLANEGYLRQLHRGYEVVELTDQEIMNAYAVRGMLEGMAARQVASTRRRVSIARLQEAYEQELDAFRTGRAQRELWAAIENFHAVLADASANDFLQSVLKVARWRTEPYTRRRSNIAGTDSRDIEEHGQLLQAIGNGEALLAELTARMLTRRAVRELTGRELAGDIEMTDLLSLIQGRASIRSGT